VLTTDPYNLARFLEAQAGAYEVALDEIRRGRKRTHWMWFIFPQLAGLGSSHTATFYAISGLAEARAYLEHPVLARRLEACATAVSMHADASADRILGAVDALKLRSSLTLFEVAGPGVAVFGQALDAVCAGERDAWTLERLRAAER